MARKTYVLDTNVLLHDPEAIQKFEDNDVVMPLVVLEELDKMKRFTDELGKNARNVIRFIDGIKGDLFNGISIDNGVNFSIFTDNVPSQKEGFPLPLDSIKHRILFSAYKLQREGREVVVLVSKDFVLRIKAGSIGIEAQDYESLKESFDNLYKGYRKLEIPKQQIDTFMTKGFLEKNSYLMNTAAFSATKNQLRSESIMLRKSVLRSLILLEMKFGELNPLMLSSNVPWIYSCVMILNWSQ